MNSAKVKYFSYTQDAIISTSKNVNLGQALEPRQRRSVAKLFRFTLFGSGPVQPESSVYGARAPNQV